MKRIALLAIVGMAFNSAFAQGTFISTSIGTGANSTSVNAPVFLGTVGGTKLTGTGYAAQWYWGSSGTAEGSLINSFMPVQNFNSGALAGFLSPTPTISISGIAVGGAAQLQLRAWDLASGSTWETATTRGQSTSFLLSNLGDSQVPATQPVPAGLSSFAITVVPEPSTVVLGVMGGLALLLRRRK